MTPLSMEKPSHQGQDGNVRSFKAFFCSENIKGKKQNRKLMKKINNKLIDQFVIMAMDDG